MNRTLWAMILVTLLVLTNSDNGSLWAQSPRFSRNEEGVITDSKTGLEWQEGPDRPITWLQAADWIKDLGSGWRFPTLGELEGIFIDDGTRLGGKGISKEGKNEGPYVIKLDPAFKNDSAYWIWSVQSPYDNTCAKFYYFNIGEDGAYGINDTVWCLRAVAVREPKKR